MKRFRVTAGSNTQIKIFNSMEAVFAWHVGDAVEDQEYVEFEIQPNDFIDVELMGFEFVNDGKQLICFNLVQIANAKATKNEAGHSFDVKLGYINDTIFPLRSGTFDTLTIKRLDDHEGIQMPYPFDENDE